MARPKTVSYASANIVLHPHNTELYSKLFKTAHSIKSVGFINRNRRARIGFIEDVVINRQIAFIYGRLYFYAQIDPNQPWLDDKIDDIADEESLETIRKEIENLHPEFKAMRFLFHLHSHTLYFECLNEKSNTFSPGTVKKALDSIFSDNSIIEKYGETEITITPVTDAIDRILSIPTLNKLIIDLQKPNPDDWGEDEAVIAEKLDNMNAKRLKEELTKAAGEETLKPDKETTALARVASRNGSVEGIGYDNNKKRKESTRSHPQIDIIPIDEDEMTPRQTFFEYVRRKILR